jgi:transposase-like protein
MVPGMETPTPNPTGGAKRRRFTEHERSEHLIAWKRSGQSARDYAAEHGLSTASLYAWSAKKRDSPAKRASGSSFVPVRIAPGGSSGTGLRVTLKSRGMECVIEGADAPGAFAELAAALKREVFDV